MRFMDLTSSDYIWLAVQQTWGCKSKPENGKHRKTSENCGKLYASERQDFGDAATMRSFARCRWTEHQDHLTSHQASQGHQHSHNTNKIKQVIKIQGARRALALLNLWCQVTRSKLWQSQKKPKTSQNTCLIKRKHNTTNWRDCFAIQAFRIFDPRAYRFGTVCPNVLCLAAFAQVGINLNHFATSMTLVVSQDRNSLSVIRS